MNARLERLCRALVKEHAPQLFHDTTTLGLPLPRRLASYGVLVLACDPLQFGAGEVQRWENAHIQLYDLLARTLFKTLTGVSSYYPDDDTTPVLCVLVGQAISVIKVLSGFVEPYIAARHGHAYSETDLRGLMDIVLEELAADDLPRPKYNALRAEAMALVYKLTMLPVKPVALAPFDRPLWEDLPTEPLQTGDTAPAAPLDERSLDTTQAAPVNPRGRVSGQPPRPTTLPGTGPLAQGGTGTLRPAVAPAPPPKTGTLTTPAPAQPPARPPQPATLPGVGTSSLLRRLNPAPGTAQPSAAPHGASPQTAAPTTGTGRLTASEEDVRRPTPGRPVPPVPLPPDKDSK